MNGEAHNYPDLVQGLSRLVHNTKALRIHADLRERFIIEVANLLCDLVDSDRRMDLGALDLPGRLQQLGGLVEAMNLQSGAVVDTPQIPRPPAPPPFSMHDVLSRTSAALGERVPPGEGPPRFPPNGFPQNGVGSVGYPRR